MKLVLDMHVSVEVARQLRLDGYEVFQVRERGLQKLKDIGIIPLALSERRVVVAFDLDFSAILAQTGADWPSVVQIRIENAKTEYIAHLLRSTLPAYQKQLEDGCILLIERNRIRVRRLPLVVRK